VNGGATVQMPKAPSLGGFEYYIQRGATLQTYRPLGHVVGQAIQAATQAIDTLIAVPFPVGLSCSMDEIAFNVSTLAAGSSARVGIYRATSAKNIYPGALVVDSGAVATTSTGFKNTAVSVNLKPGLYWSVYVAGVLAPQISGWGVSTTNPGNPILGYTNANPPLCNHSLRVAFAFAALPATFPGGAALSAGPGTAIFGRFSA
jgi:hypothetical protein